MRFELLEGGAEVPSTSVVEPWPLRLWGPSEAEKSGLLKVVLARFLINDIRFSSKERSSLMLSLRATMRRLFRFSVPASINLEPATEVCVGGRGKSEGRMLSTLVASVANEPQLLLSIVASRPRLRTFRRLSGRRGLRLAPSRPIPNSTSSSD
jgi:hypothetical protein